jgi:ribosomal protein S12
MPTIRQLSFKERIRKRRRPIAAALLGAPNRRGVIVYVGQTTPKKPNSGKRKYFKVRVIASNKIVFAHQPGEFCKFLQKYHIVRIEGGNPPDVPGINYTIIRGQYDFFIGETFRKKGRSKYGLMNPKKKLIGFTREQLVAQGIQVNVTKDKEVLRKLEAYKKKRGLI